MARGALCAIALAQPMVAQDPSALPLEATPGAWVGNASPLLPLAELPRTLLGAQLAAPDLLISSSPRVGMFWTGGHPAGLARDVASGWSRFQVGSHADSGVYRRPLDPGEMAGQSIDGVGWGPLGSRGAGFARLAVTQGEQGAGAFSNLLVPYATEPYAVLDTLGERTQTTTVRTEAAGGWRVGAFAAGLAFGYHQQERSTIESAVPRRLRSTTPTLTGGLAFDVAGRTLTIGAYGRVRRSVEVVNVFSLAAISRVYRVQGYDEPFVINLASNSFSRRFERRARAGGVAAAGAAGDFTWAAFAQRELLAAENFSFAIGALSDTWDADAWTFGGALQKPLFARRWLVTIDGRFTALEGSATHPSIEGVPFRADERRWHLAGEIRMLPARGWEGAVRLGLTRSERERTDGLVEVASILNVWRPAGAIEVARHFGSLAVSFGAAMAEHNPAGGIPDAQAMEPVYRSWMAPEMALEATGAQYRGLTATVRWQARPVTGFWIRGRYETTDPVRGTTRLSGAPTEGRHGWSAALGVVIGG